MLLALPQSVAENLDIHPFMLSRWRNEYRDGIIVADKRKKIAGQTKTKKVLTKEQELERENKTHKEELYILKKRQRYLTGVSFFEYSFFQYSFFERIQI
jgi:transposase